MIKVLLIFLIACFGYSDYFTGKSLQTRPLVLGPLVGLAMGDLQTGCVIGATMELHSHQKLYQVEFLEQLLQLQDIKMQEWQWH